MILQLYQSHTITALVLKIGKKSINWVSGHFRDLKVTLQLHLQTSNFSQTKITYRTYSILWDVSDLPFPSYKAKYVKNVELNV